VNPAIHIVPPKWAGWLRESGCEGVEFAAVQYKRGADSGPGSKGMTVVAKCGDPGAKSAGDRA
jgi:hypothetical protein